MTDREKLIQLIDCVQYEGIDYTDVIFGNPVQNERLADYLIANGVTFATDKNVGHWIPVSERLPKESGEYLAYCGKYDGICVLYYEIMKTKSKWRTNWKEVTHWMPLPESPEDDC